MASLQTTTPRGGVYPLWLCSLFIRYDPSGNLVNWWTERDAAEYEKRSAVVVAQAEAFEVKNREAFGGGVDVGPCLLTR